MGGRQSVRAWRDIERISQKNEQHFCTEKSCRNNAKYFFAFVVHAIKVRLSETNDHVLMIKIIDPLEPVRHWFI